MGKTAARGRPRNFDIEQSLQAALQVFLEKGYEGASLDDLTVAMGISRPSLYAAFGNKEALFLRVLSLYSDPSFETMKDILFTENRSVQQSFEALFSWFSQNHSCQDQMQGCLMVNSTILCRADNPDTHARLQTLNLRNENLFQERLEQAIEQEELSPQADVRALAQYFNGLMQGMGVMARQRNSAEILENIAKTGLQVFSCFIRDVKNEA